MKSVLFRAMTILALSLSVVACDDVILPPPDGGNGGDHGGGNGGGDTVVTTGIIQGIVAPDSSVSPEDLVNARVALMWHRKDGTQRVGSIVALDSSLHFLFSNLAPLDAEDLLVDATSNRTNTPYGIASIVLITNPDIHVGYVWNAPVVDSRDFVFTSPTHDVIYRAASSYPVQGADMWLDAFPKGYTLGLKYAFAPETYVADPNGFAILPYTKLP